LAKAARIWVRNKRPFYWSIVGLEVLLVLVLIFLLLAPKLINLESFRQKAIAGFHEKTGGRIDYQRVDLSFFPRPCVVIYEAKMSVPEKGKGRIESISIYPRILSLLRGRVRITQVLVDAPNFTITLPERRDREAVPRPEERNGALEGILRAMVAPLSLEAPDLIFLIERGTLTLLQEEKPAFSFGRLSARFVLPPTGFKVVLNCTSNLWKEMHLESTLGLEPLKASGRIDFNGLQPHRLSTYMFPQAAENIGNSDVDLGLTFNMEGLRAWKADFVAPFFRFAFRQGDTAAVLKGKGMKGVFQKDGDTTSISLSQVQLDAPSLALSGRLVVGGPSQGVRAELEGTGVNISAVRETALAAAGHIQEVKEIFEVVKSGTVPRMTFRAQGKSLCDLGDLNNMVIEGRLVDGGIFLPEAGLDLAEAQGDAVISGGTLEGKNLEARFGNSWGRQGRLKVDFKGDDAPFHLDMMVDADLAQLPPILRKVLDNSDLVQELDFLKEVKGRGVGKLTLGESQGAVDAKIDVSELEFFARYKRVPYPITISGGRFVYEERAMSVEDFVGSVGKSSFSQLSARIDWKKQPYFEVRSALCQIVLEEIFPWVTSLDELSRIRENFNVPQGFLDITEMECKGPLRKPSSWQFKTAGSYKDVVLAPSSLPDVLKISSGTFTAASEGPEQPENPDMGGEKKGETSNGTPVKGRLTLKADEFTYKFIHYAPLHAQISFGADKLRVEVTEAQLCGLSTPGVLELSPEQYSLEFSTLAENQDVAQTVNCLFSERLNATGRYTLKGVIRGRSKPEAWLRALQGDVELRAENGRIDRHVPMQRLLAYLNVTDLFKGRIPDMSKEGFPYNFITAKMDIQNGQLIFREWILDSPSMQITGQGAVDFEENTVDMAVLVAPLKAVDSVLRKIPGVNYVTGGTLVSVAAKIEGDVKNPKVKALPASAVGEGLLGMMKRTLKLPIKVIEPMRSRGEVQEVSPQDGP
jgi:hypothetical protein